MTKNIALIATGGIGTRMGNITIPKVMLKDLEGRYFIDDALTFQRYESENLDFYVFGREGIYKTSDKRSIDFNVLNDYLRNVGFSERQLLFQKTKPRSMVVAFLAEYIYNADFRGVVRYYDNVLIIPGDNKLTSDDLNLDDLLMTHERNNSDVTMIYSRGIQNDSSKKDIIQLGKNNLLLSVKRDKDYQVMEDYERATSVGIWLLRRDIISPSIIIPLVSFLLNKGSSANGLKAYAYFIRNNWAGGRDTPESIGK